MAKRKIEGVVVIDLDGLAPIGWFADLESAIATGDESGYNYLALASPEDLDGLIDAELGTLVDNAYHAWESEPPEDVSRDSVYEYVVRLAQRYKKHLPLNQQPIEAKEVKMENTETKTGKRSAKRNVVTNTIGKGKSAAGKAAGKAKPATGGAAGKAKPATRNGPGRPAEVDDGTKIKVLVKENPKRPGSAAADRFELYFRKDVKTVGDFLEAGGKRPDLKWDADKGFIELD